MGRIRRLYLLAGTEEAVALCEALGGEVSVVAALDNRFAEAPRDAFPESVDLRAPPRSSAGLITAVKWDRVQAVVDASHPFGVEPARYAATACRALGLPLLQLRRPPFTDAELGPMGRRVPDIEAAVRALPPFGRAFLNLPLDRLAAFGGRPMVWYLARAFWPAAGRFPLRRGDFTVGAPPFTLAHERILLEDYRIDHLVLGDVGGALAAPTLTAARERDARIIAVAPPEPPPPPSRGAPRGARVASVAAACDWIRRS